MSLRDKLYDSFMELAEHPQQGKLFAKLNHVDLSFCHNFIMHNDFKSAYDFKYKATQVFLDSKSKPVNHNIISELLLSAGSGVGDE